ncbi:MAG: hypothetical protein ACRD22_06370 [Terriglobia bacterium]
MLTVPNLHGLVHPSVERAIRTLYQAYNGTISNPSVASPWNAATQYHTGDEVTDPGNLYQALQPNINAEPSSHANYWQKLGPSTLDDLPNGTSYVKLLASRSRAGISYNFQGIWSAGFNYQTGDEVFYGTSYWVATSQSTATPPAIGIPQWQNAGSYSEYTGAWSSSTNYVTGAEVTYQGNYWVCTQSNTNQAPVQSSSYWTLAGPASMDNIANGQTYVKILASHARSGVGFNFQGIWSPAISYVIGDEVFLNATYWQAQIANSNSQPSTSNSNWQSCGTYSEFLGAWSSATAYAIGAEVTYQGNYWICAAANTNSAPSLTNTNWQMTGPTSLQYIQDGDTRFAAAELGADVTVKHAILNMATGSTSNPSIPLASTQIDGLSISVDPPAVATVLIIVNITYQVPFNTSEEFHISVVVDVDGGPLSAAEIDQETTVGGIHTVSFAAITTITAASHTFTVWGNINFSGCNYYNTQRNLTVLELF